MVLAIRPSARACVDAAAGSKGVSKGPNPLATTDPEAAAGVTTSATPAARERGRRGGWSPSYRRQGAGARDHRYSGGDHGQAGKPCPLRVRGAASPRRRPNPEPPPQRFP